LKTRLNSPVFSKAVLLL